MSDNKALSGTKNWTRRASIGGVAALALVVGGLGLAANAAGGTFAVYDEDDSPNPYNVTEGLVFYKGADLGWIVDAPIGDIDSLAYTVAEGTSYAPSFQLVTHSDQKSYARLVWEPYMQSGALDPNTGEYTDLQDGLWWTSKIGDPAPGSQSAPQPLSFFTETWTNIVVDAIDVHQGTTSDIVSVVTKVSYNGTDIPLGNPDLTPFNQADVDAAVAAATGPLLADISGLQDDLADATGDVTELQGQLLAKQDELAAVQSELTDAQSDLLDAQDDIDDLNATIGDLLAESSDLQDQVADLRDELDAAQGVVATLQGQLATAQADLTTAQSNVTTAQTTLAGVQAQLAATEVAFTAYKANHHTADATNLGKSRALLAATPTHGKTVGVKLSGSIAKATSVKYQWYLGGKAVSGATKSTFKVPSNARGKSVSVAVSGTYKYMVFAVHSNTVKSK